MARATGLPEHQGRAFRFSRQTTKDLLALFDDSAVPITELQNVVGAVLHEKSARPAHNGQSEILKTITALRAVIRRIDETSPLTHKLLSQPSTLGDIYSKNSAWESLTATRKNAAQSLRRLESIATPRQRGRPRSVDREWLSIGVASALKLSGVRVATSRDGTFGRALSTILIEIYGDSAPQELFPLIKLGSRFVKEKTLEGLRRFIGDLCGYLNSL
jgi:hypothetical protein